MNGIVRKSEQWSHAPGLLASQVRTIDGDAWLVLTVCGTVWQVAMAKVGDPWATMLRGSVDQAWRAAVSSGPSSMVGVTVVGETVAQLCERIVTMAASWVDVTGLDVVRLTGLVLAYEHEHRRRCDYCDVPVFTGIAGADGRVFCGQTCHDGYADDDADEGVCLQCGNSRFLDPPVAGHGRVFCDRECLDLWENDPANADDVRPHDAGDDAMARTLILDHGTDCPGVWTCPDCATEWCSRWGSAHVCPAG